MPKVDMTVDLKGLKLRNPLLTASGTYGFGEEYAAFVPLEQLGGITVKGITPERRLGNPAPRLRETPAGLLNAVGLQNPGLRAFKEEYLPRLRRMDTAVIVNISGFSPEDFKLMAQELTSGLGIAALEVNISCPNVAHGGIFFGTDPASAEEVLAIVRQNTDLPVIAKLSPNVTDIKVMAEAVVRGGADAISLINTLIGMSIDLDTQRPFLGNKTGGLSGPAVRPIAVRMVYEVYTVVDVPIIGMGGIMCWQDAVEFILAGASAISVGTANFSNPKAPIEILYGLERYAEKNGCRSVRDLVGRAHKKD